MSVFIFKTEIFFKYFILVTPFEYQPPGFVDAIHKDTLGFAVENIRVKIGNVITPHACMKVRIRAPKHHFEGAEVGNACK